ncbi:protein containing DUF1559 [Rhodopirellula baltica SH28]|uniref:Protein containing DUF1559 n=2 Tax=Rhodopirellula baltica TaxID=265606 RepID=K5D7V4_RHOBT|nr:protein containing DUF1559 [Rhodopirellula baltica SH28]
MFAGGCGPSKEELMMRAAQRTRPKSHDEKKEDAKQTPRPVSVSVASDDAVPGEGTAPSVGKPVRSPAAAVLEEETSGEEQQKKITWKTISERMPTSPLSESERHARAVDNLERLSVAILAYKNDKGHYPPAAHLKSGVKTLSWRVLILPYLGQKDLFDQFDLNVPWNRSPNKELVEFIPDVFVSPERFDTKTNWMFPTYRTFMFGENRYPRDRNMEDGVDNTIMLVEVNDDLAVEWTRPVDYEPESFDVLKDSVGELRSGGTLVAWANGWPSYISNSVSTKQWTNAFTHESGDGQRAGAIHKEPDALLAANKPTRSETKVEAKVSGRVEASKVVENTEVEAESWGENRLPVPPSPDLATSNQRIEQLFGEQLVRAKQNQTQAELSNDFLKKSLVMSDDAAGAYALQNAAIDLAIDSGDFMLFQTVLDQHASTFEVDLYQVNRDGLLEFSRRNDVDEDTASQMAFVRRALVAIQEGLKRNDFEGVGRIASALPRVEEERRGFRRANVRGGKREVSAEKLVRILQTQLSSANKQYEQAAEKVAEYRKNPNDAELASALGRFYCFLKGDWAMGLPLVINGTSEKLSRVAKRDLESANVAEDFLAIGDMWWELSEGLPAGIYRQGTRDRAGYWYEQALEVMPESLDRLHVQARVKEWQSQDPGSPLATIRTINRQLGLAENADLEQVVARKRTQVNAPGDDYEDG